MKKTLLVALMASFSFLAIAQVATPAAPAVRASTAVKAAPATKTEPARATVTPPLPVPATPVGTPAHVATKASAAASK